MGIHERFSYEHKGVCINYRPIFLIAIGMAMGIFVSSRISFKLCAVLSLCIGLILFISAFAKRKSVAVICLGILFGMLRFVMSVPVDTDVSDGVQNIAGRVYLCNKNSLTITDITLNGQPMKGKLFIYNTDTKTLCVDDKVTFNARLEKTANCENRSYKNYLCANGIKYLADYDNIMAFRVCGKATTVHGVCVRVRESIKEHIGKLYGNDSDMVCGILLGVTSDMEYNVKSDMRGAGLAHIFALSGLHIAVLAGAAEQVLKHFGLGKKRLLLSGLILSYCAIAGFPVSLVRASVMLFVRYFTEYINVRYDTLSACGLAAVCILTVNPYQLFMAGFLLSFCSVLGIIMLEKPIRDLFSRRISYAVQSAIAVPTAAALGIAPVAGGIFGAVPFYAVPVNVVAVPMASLALVSAFVSVCIGLICTAAAFPFILMTKVILRILIMLSSAVADLDFAVISVGSIPLVCGVLWMLALYASSKYVIAKGKYKLLTSASMMALSLMFYVVLQVA